MEGAANFRDPLFTSLWEEKFKSIFCDNSLVRVANSFNIHRYGINNIYDY